MGKPYISSLIFLQVQPCPKYYLSVDMRSILHQYLYYKLDTVWITEIQCNKKLSLLPKHYTQLSNIVLQILIFHAQINDYVASKNM